MKSLRNTLLPALRAEAQAIAIYRAEVYWVRGANRKAFLTHILKEEEAHLGALSHWEKLSPIDHFINTAAGLIIGSLLASLPWKWLCPLQSKAELQASQIYKIAKNKLELAQGPKSVIKVLHEALSSENRHAQMFLIDAPLISS
ncbi:MAG: hypothetical protein KA715_08680 [Xanthomonadaceae bacterium]|nr:hypothetical protein [Xanthomonadaceae bacterium]